MQTKTRSSSRYFENGYAIIREGLPSPLMDRVAKELLADISDRSKKQNIRMENLVEPQVQAQNWRFWLELCRHPLILQQVRKQMECEELILLMSHLIVKPPYDGLEVCWHQDNTYWKSVVGTDACTVWLAIDDVDRENSCMHVIPRSHQGFPELEKIPTAGDDLLHVKVEVTPEMEAGAVACELKRGEFSIHDSFIIHGSSKNTSSRRRAGYTMRYGNAATLKVDIEKHWVPVYYVAGDSRNLKQGMIDLRPGCELPVHPGRK